MRSDRKISMRKNKMDDLEQEPKTKTQEVVAKVLDKIKEGSLSPGQYLPPERDFAIELGISRASLRSGLHALTKIGVLHSNRGVGTYVAEGPPKIGSEPLKLLGELHGFKPDEIYEARRLLETLLAGLAAERAGSNHLASLADELTSMYASSDDSKQYLEHDIRFHRAISAAAGNPILATVAEMVSSMHFEMITKHINHARDSRELTEMHLRIYRAIRDHNPDEARAAMNNHILESQRGYKRAMAAEKKIPRTRHT